MGPKRWTLSTVSKAPWTPSLAMVYTSPSSRAVYFCIFAKNENISGGGEAYK